MSFPRYPEYKESGVEWLGEVPAHWVIKRLSHYFEERREKASDAEFAPLSVTKNGVVPRLETAAKTQDGDNRKKVCAGDFVINSRSDRKGSAGLSPTDGTVSLICIVLEPKKVKGGFVHHLLRSVPFQEEFYRYGKGIVADLWSTSYSEMKNIVLALPLIDEQKHIATFLDHETARIDNLVEEQKRLIELLKEKRQAVISHAVTKGLNPDVPMKESGVEWLGEVPAHWEIKQLKHVVNPATSITYGIVQAGPDYEGGVPYIKTSDMSGDELPLHGYSKTSPEIDRSYRRSKVSSGDVVVAIRATVGKCLKVPEGLGGANLTQGTAKVSPGEKVLPDFLLFSMRSNPTQAYFDEMAKGATFKEITLDSLRRVPIALPPVSEQEAIMTRVANVVQSIEKLLFDANKSVLLLQERRSALISAAVTGKIDVRGWKPPAGSSTHSEATQAEAV
jgi:type I restriction enzyme S subunit